jgi:hypothetical protein
MTKLTEHFTIEELTTTDMEKFKKQNYEEGARRGHDLLILANFAEKIRAILNCAMVITSGYRCAELNAAIGGSPTSQHLFCQAIDFIPMGMSAEQAYSLIQNSELEYGQLILEKRGAGYIIHASTGIKHENLYSPEQGKYIREV